MWEDRVALAQSCVPCTCIHIGIEDSTHCLDPTMVAILRYVCVPATSKTRPGGKLQGFASVSARVFARLCMCTHIYKYII